MAIIKRLPKVEIEADYTHYALMYGLIPIYFNEANNGVCVRNWWPEWILDLADEVYWFFEGIQTTCDPMYEPMFPIKLVKKIKAN